MVVELDAEACFAESGLDRRLVASVSSDGTLKHELADDELEDDEMGGRAVLNKSDSVGRVCLTASVATGGELCYTIHKDKLLRKV